MTLVATKDYAADPSQMLADYAARRRRMDALAAQFIAAQRPKKIKLMPPPPPELPQESPHEVALRDWLRLAPPESLRPASSSVVLQSVSDRMGVSRVELVGECRTGEVVLARHVACWLMREHVGLSYPRIGQVLGGRDHTTVLHGVRKVSARKERDIEFSVLLDAMSTEINARSA